MFYSEAELHEFHEFLFQEGFDEDKTEPGVLAPLPIHLFNPSDCQAQQRILELQNKVNSLTESYKKSQFELNELRNDNQHIEKYKEDNEKLKKRLSDMNDLIEIEKSRILKEKDEDESEGNLEEEEEEEHQDYEDNDSGEE